MSTKVGKPKPLKLGKSHLTLEEVREVAQDFRRVELDSSAVSRIQASREFLLGEVAAGKTLYGVNTGFGLMSNVKIADSSIEELQYNLLRSHAVGMGEAIAEKHVRAMLLLRAQALVQGHSGVSLGLVEQILLLLNRKVHPVIPSQGSVGASGDLAPLSHLALVLIGEGRATFKGKVVSGRTALREAGIKPIRLGAKEGLALINGTQFMAALGTLALLDAEHLADVADAAGAMSLEALRGTVAAFDADIQSVRPHPGQILVAKRVRQFLQPSGAKSAIAKSHEGCGRVQDPYSLRCIPQVHGASRDTMSFVRQVLEREINAVTDNPLVFPEKKKVVSGGNFHGQIVAIALDTLCIAVAELASISEQRLEKLINPAISELPAFLVKEGGLNSGFMIVQVAAAAIVSENKTLCHPASVDSISTSADKEDHVSMGAWAARKANLVVTNSRRVLAMELLAGAQGIDLLRPLKSTAPLEALHRQVRRFAKRLDRDRFLHDEMVALEKLIESRELEKFVRS